MGHRLGKVMTLTRSLGSLGVSASLGILGVF